MRPSPLEDQQEFQLPQVSRGDFLAFFQPIGTHFTNKISPLLRLTQLVYFTLSG
jgi:hypothetical protein